ncbi:MAG: TPM domain-containing protein [Chthoniobacterales bacterium]
MFLRLFLALFLVAGGGVVKASPGETLPPAPRQYVTDEAGVIAPGLLAQLNQRLGAFEKATSTQIVAVVYPKLPEGAALDDYAQRLYSAWKIGTKKNSNGVLMLVFVQDRKMRIQTGYGLEGAMPDALCSRIIRETMAPAFRDGKYGAGLASGISAVMQATKGEYKGTGRKSDKPMTLLDFLFSPLGFFLLVMIVLVVINRNRRDVGRGDISPGAAAATGFFLGGMGGGGGSGGGDSGGFSGGGGESGGGGSSGDW